MFRTLRLSVLSLALLVLGVFSPWAWGQTPMAFYHVSREVPILQALGILENSSHKDDLAQAMARQPLKILFKDMRELGKAYQAHDAVTLIGQNDEQIIILNARHATAPPEALAALISHELMHNDRDNSLAEEVAAWNTEAATWREMCAQKPALQHISSRQYPLVDRLNAITILVQQNRLPQELQQNIAYQNLPPHSPGF